METKDSFRGKMKISNGLPINNGSVRISKCGKYVAYGYQNILRIISLKSRENVSAFSCTHNIKNVDWHFDSDHVLCLLDKTPKVQAFSLSDPEWFCTIKEGKAGLKAAVWSPRGYHILTLAEFNVRISIWSLAGQSVTCIYNPILKKHDEFSFSLDGNYLAVMVGSGDRYKIKIYSTSSWTVTQEIKCTCKISIPSSPLWSPTNLHIVLWERLDFKTGYLEVYSVEKSQLVGTFKESGSELYRISWVSWTPAGQFLMIGCHNECIYVLNYITWKTLTILSHPQIITNKYTQIYAETKGESNIKLIEQRPVTLSKVKPSINTNAPPRIASIVPDRLGQYVATHCSSMPAVVWVWELTNFCLKTVIILKNSVADLKWNIKDSRLLVCSKGTSVMLWTPEKPIHVQFSAWIDGLAIRGGYWCPKKGNNFIIFTASFMYFVYDFCKKVLELHR